MTNETPETTPETGAEGWTTTEVAAAALGITPRRVKQLIVSGELYGRQVKRGRARPYEVGIASLKRVRDRRVALGQLEQSQATGEIPAGGYEGEGRAEGIERALVALVDDLRRLTARAARSETLLELTEQTESSLREELEETRRERDALRDALQSERSKSLWSRLFSRQ